MGRVKRTPHLATSEDLDSGDLGNVNVSPLELEPMKDRVEPSFYFGR